MPVATSKSLSPTRLKSVPKHRPGTFFSNLLLHPLSPVRSSSILSGRVRFRMNSSLPIGDQDACPYPCVCRHCYGGDRRPVRGPDQSDRHVDIPGKIRLPEVRKDAYSHGFATAGRVDRSCRGTQTASRNGRVSIDHPGPIGRSEPVRLAACNRRCLQCDGGPERATVSTGRRCASI